jgi:hypothetical protein
VNQRADMGERAAAAAVRAGAPAHASNRYVAVLLASLLAVLGAVLSLNLLLGQRSMGSVEIVRAASEWQQVTRGVTYPPPITANRPFKILRLHDRLPEISGVVFGASSAMGLGAGAFPEAVRIYNFAQTANPLQATIPEAEYVVRHHGDRVKWIFLELNWAVGILYQPGEPGHMDLSREAALAGEALARVGLRSRLADAVSWPRVRNLWELARGAWRSGRGLGALREAFLEPSSTDYRCADGTLARDFDTINRGICTGFRFDGSATFTDGKRVDPARGEQLARAAAAPSSKYSRALAATGGDPERVLLERLGALAAELRRRGGTLVLFAPPLIPGLERALAGSAHAGPAVRRTKEVLDEWGRGAGVTIIDAGASERFGCTTREFLDEHHAFGECYERVFGRFWSERAAGAVGAGLWPAPRRP